MMGAGGVPVHVMEVVDYPSEATPERAQAFKVIVIGRV